MLDSTSPILQPFLRQGYRVSVQAHMAPGRPVRYTVIARRPDGDRAQGWGNSAAEAVDDLRRRAGMLVQVGQPDAPR